MHGTRDAGTGGPAVDAPGVVVFHRSARVFPAPPAGEPIVVAAPPVVPPPSGRGLLQLLLPLAGSLGVVGFAFAYRNPLLLAIAGGVALLTVAVSVAAHVGQRRMAARQRRRNADRYRAHLADRRRELEAAADAQRAAAARVHPDPAALPAVVTARRHLWERRREDPDFLEVRVGLGPVPLAVPVRFDLGSDPLADYEPDLLAEARSVLEGASLPAMPVTMPAAGLGSVAVVGERAAAQGLVRALVCQLTAWHDPDDLRLLAWFEPGQEPAWSWMKWLPHAGETAAAPGGDPRHPVALATDLGDLDVLLSQLVRPRLEHLERVRAAGPSAPAVAFQPAVVILDGYDPLGPSARVPALDELLGRAAEIGVLVLALVARVDQAPSQVGALLELGADGRLDYLEPGPSGRRAPGLRADAAPVEPCEAMARAMTPLVPRGRRGRSAAVGTESLLDLLELAGAPAGSLSTPIGVLDDGSPLLLDLKEAAEGGMGPHGLIVGATGSGKSELLRTLVTGLALGHSPEELALVLVDFKGGATFAELAGLPHVAGVITNLERDLTLVDRMRAALFGELERRQRALQVAGPFDRARDYQAHRAARPDSGLPPLPTLLVLVDEFGELLSARPDFLELFVSIGRTGRSLGVHLLLATQRLDEGRIRGLEGHLRYRVCLRTFSPEESTVALGGREAFELPPLPGLGFLRVDAGRQRFKAALVTRPYRERRRFAEQPSVVRAFGVGGLGAELAVVGNGSAPPARPRPSGAPARSELQVAVDALTRAAGPGSSVRQVWLPPLPAVLSLDALPGLAGRERLDRASPGQPGWLQVAVGLLDRPHDQAQVPFTLDFSGAGGHLAVAGAPRSGKSTLLQSVVAGLTLTHDPGDVAVYAVDLGGGGLHALAGIPHVGAVYGRTDREEVHRLVRELRAVVADRAAAFRGHRFDGMAAYHRARRAGLLPGARHGEVFLAIDNWALFATEFADLVEDVLALAAGGLHYGVHLLVTTNRWSDLRIALRDNLGGRLELRLNDPIESEIDRHAARALPADTPGRGLDRQGRQFQAALPRLDGLADIGGLGLGIERLVDEVAARWPDAPTAPPIRLLPAEVRPADLPDPAADPAPGVAIGLEEFGLGPVRVDLFGVDPHFLVLGDDRCGKTNLLRAWTQRLAARHPPERVRIALVDYRRQLLDAVGEDHRFGYAWTAEQARGLAGRLAAACLERLPAEEEPVEAPSGPRTWTGPQLVLVVDDYDLVAGGLDNPLAALVGLLAQGRDVGLHLVLARRVSGLARSAFEPLLQRLRELSPPGLVMSGDPQEGPLLGGRKAEPLPPGRGWLVAQRSAVLVQTVRVPAPDPEGRR